MDVDEPGRLLELPNRDPAREPMVEEAIISLMRSVFSLMRFCKIESCSPIDPQVSEAVGWGSARASSRVGANLEALARAHAVPAAVAGVEHATWRTGKNHIDSRHGVCRN